MVNPFIIEKGKKTGYYLNTPENRKQGRVGQKYIIDIVDDPEKNRIQQQLDSARARAKRGSLSESSIKNKIAIFKRKQKEEIARDKAWIEEHGEYLGPDWKISDNIIRTNLLLEDAEISGQTNPETEEQKQEYVDNYELDRKKRVDHMNALVDSLFKNPDNELIDEEFAWTKTKDLEIIREFNSVARISGITQKVPNELIEEVPKPILKSWWGEGKEFYTEEKPEVDYTKENRKVFKDHIESSILWNNNTNYFSYMKDSIKSVDNLNVIEIDNTNTRKDFLTRLPVLELDTVSAEIFLHNPIEGLRHRGLMKTILRPDKKYGNIIISIEDEDLLFSIKKIGFDTINPKSKKKVSIVAKLGFKVSKLKNPVDNLNYKLPISKADPILIDKIDRTIDDDERDLIQEINSIGIDGVQTSIDEMEALPPYELEDVEDELEALYFKKHKYHELNMFLKEIQEQK